jgi:uncharacterized damage-inducible protein DinB
MTPKTMTEKDMFLQSFERECQTTLRILRAYPPGESELKPHERSKSARELAWIFTLEQLAIADAAIKGQLDFSKPRPEPPATFMEVIPAFEKASRATATRVAQMNEGDLNQTMKFPSGPGTMSDQRRIDVLWVSLMDQIHHRGQLSVYLRMSGAKVPSIYGPSADEPWM